MKVFVTGATGVLGRPVVRRLVAAGHTVRGLSRSPENAALLRRLGAEPVDADLFDLVSLQVALRDADAVFHLATKIPPSTRSWRLSAWAENDRIRRDGTRALVTAALASPTVKTFVYPSFALVYPESGDEWIDAENTPAAPTAIEATTLDAEAEVAHGRALQSRRAFSPGSASYRASGLRAGAWTPSGLHAARLG